jgi:tripartite ATP-independent transporter DctP family solute receptor
MNIQRRQFNAAAFSAAATLGVGFGVAKAQAAPITFRIGFNLPESHAITVRCKEAAVKIKDETNGRFELRVFPNNQLGGDTDMLSQIRAGGLELFLNSGINVLSTMIPSASVYGLGFIFPDHAAVWKAMDGELGAYVRAQIAKAGLVPLEKMWDNGFRNITTSTKPINGPGDLKGLKIRVPVGALWTSMFKAFGAAPASINFSEIYSALQTKVVDAQETPLALIYTANIFEVQKYCSLTNHMWDGFFCLANRKAWEGLPSGIRDVVAKHLNNAALLERDDLAKANESYQTQLAAKGLIFNKPAIPQFREALKAAGFYKEWRAKYGEELWSLLEKSVGSLA